MILYQQEILKWEANISTLKKKSLFLSKSKISVSVYDRREERYIYQFIIGHSKVTLWCREITPIGCPYILHLQPGCILGQNLNQINSTGASVVLGITSPLIHTFYASN